MNSIASLLLKPLQRVSTLNIPLPKQSGFVPASVGMMDQGNDYNNPSDLRSLRSLRDQPPYDPSYAKLMQHTDFISCEPETSK